MTRWEMRWWDRDDDHAGDTLESLGLQGWEPVGVTDRSYEGKDGARESYVQVLLKRPVDGAFGGRDKKP